MAEQIEMSTVRDSLLRLFDNITSHVQGYMLEPGKSLLEVLPVITAEEASQPISGQNASLAAQVNHVQFYMDTSLALTEEPDWDAAWKVGAVTDAEWQELVAGLKMSTERVREFINTLDGRDESLITDAVAQIGHAAYHLGEIRLGISVIRERLERTDSVAEHAESLSKS